MPVEPSDPLLLYDGLCGFCDGAVRFILRHDGAGRMRFAPPQGETAHAVLARHPGVARLDSLVVIRLDGGREVVFVRSDAALEIARYLGAPWSAASVVRLVPRPLRDWAYDVLARHRHRIFGRRTECAVPAPESRARFLP